MTALKAQELSPDQWLYDCYCHRCGKPLGKCDLGGVDWTFCKRCAKAEDVYTPPR